MTQQEWCRASKKDAMYEGTDELISPDFRTCLNPNPKKSYPVMFTHPNIVNPNGNYPYISHASWCREYFKDMENEKKNKENEKKNKEDAIKKLLNK